ncbi:energy transducer TonB [Marinobacterium sedimentorum]|uniref:energy transducer TonB n=1 Tax=Marinobacterium sedimentorum TaxID=2927804 RepID=UPI0020C7086C|nr:energy transducer TonB [Marinobacterium sedimentorum]
MNRLTTAIPATTGPAPAVGIMDRFGFTLFVAITVHAILLLGISFSTAEYKPPRKTLDITLARFASPEAPKEADFIAQANQLGSGTAETKHAPSTLEDAPFHSNEQQQQARQQSLPQPKAQEVAPQPVPTPAQAPEIAEPKPVKAAPKPQKVVTTTAPAKQKQSSQPAAAKSLSPPPTPGASTSLLARSLEIASLQAQLDLQQEQFAKKPRVRRLTAAATLKGNDAAYLDNWRREIERTGNDNYPAEARKQGIHGSLRLLVSILPDGSIRKIEVLQSSGYKVLDDAAKQIVQLAAPFQAFPVDMRKTTDELEIIRTWKFENQTRLY